MTRPALAGNPAEIARAIRGRDVLVTIAFNDAEAIDWQAVLLRRYVPGATHIVADNSSDSAAAAEIAKVAARHELPYVRLPRNPWSGSSRSHGISLNWVWCNILQPGTPRAFGFLDDDLFPTGPDDPFGKLESQDYFGVMRIAEERWFLWAGFCVFRFDAVKDKPLDFGQDWFIGLDTGGGNWEVLYRHANRFALKEMPTEFKPYKQGVSVKEGRFQWCGPWLHEVGTGGNAALSADKRRVVAELLSPHLRADRQIEAIGTSRAAAL
jgi:hypothetical protein